MTDYNQRLNNNGWLLVEKVFDSNEIEILRKHVIDHGKIKSDLLSLKEFYSIFLNQKLISALKSCLNTDELVYFGDSTTSINVKGGVFHKDSRDRIKDSPVFSDKNYSLIRFGIYLQDHTIFSKGLAVRDKSHLTYLTNKGKIINIANQLGDVIIWKLTTTHSANANSFKFASKIPINPKFAHKIPASLLKKSTNPRLAIFGTFGLRDSYCDRYIEYLKTRKYAVDRWKINTYDESIVAKLKTNGISVITDFDLDNIITDQLNVKFTQI